MVEIGYHLSSEEHGPKDLIRYAQQAEQAGFRFATISDHYLPWLERQGNSPYAWTVLGAVAQATSRLRLGTAATAPLIRYHPAILAQAAATVATMIPGRFFLGVGTGENLNEHILGKPWPEASIRREMLAEGVDIIRRLWTGDWVSYYGSYFQVENARIYTLPDELPPIYFAANSSASIDLAGWISDGLITTSPDVKLVDVFEQAGGGGKPRYGKLTICWAETDAEARRIAYEWWRQTALPGLGSILPLPRYYENASRLVTEEEVAKKLLVGPGAERQLAAIHRFIDTGFDHVLVHQIGPDQEGFFRFYEREVLPNLPRENS
jgi:G6PDH family F420-dependent oxidoreductase